MRTSNIYIKKISVNLSHNLILNLVFLVNDKTLYSWLNMQYFSFNLSEL